MTTKFLEPGGDADFLVGTTNGFWSVVTGSAAVATDFVHGGHIKSIKLGSNVTSYLQKSNVVQDAGARVSFYIYMNALPNNRDDLMSIRDTVTNICVSLSITTGGVLQLFNNNPTQLGSNGATLSTGQWYRICLAYTITDTTHNRFELFVNGVSSISVTNGTLGHATGIHCFFGNDSSIVRDIRYSDHYIDDSSALTDPGDIWVTAKRPVANGTTNGFLVQIGAGGSGVGTGHSPQVNERPLSTTNGWQTALLSTTEEYTIQSASAGDIDISGATIVDFLGWVSAGASTSVTASIIVAGSSSNISLTTTITLFTKIAGSTTYPGGNTDIGMISSGSAGTDSLYECGILVAYIPSSGYAYNVFTNNKQQGFLESLGVGT